MYISPTAHGGVVEQVQAIGFTPQSISSRIKIARDIVIFGMQEINISR
jgi:hypothetical protein